MTIRQVVRKKITRVALIFCLCFIGMFVFGEGLRGSGFDWIVVPLMLVAMGSLFYASLIIDCPKCHMPFGSTVWRVITPSFMIPYKFCPHCAVDLDSELVGP